MKQFLNRSLFLLIFIYGTKAFAQKRTANFKVVDEYVKSLGNLDTLNMGTITFIVTKKFDDNKDKARAIFDWIAYNISFDCKASRNNGNEANTSDDVLKLRKTNASGYAALFQDMCSVVKIRCLTVEGYVKNKADQINEKPDEFNHTWNVVQLGQSPESWFYVDPTMGSGYTDEKVTVFTKDYNDSYFFADRTIFNTQHYPNNTAWFLGAGSRLIKDYLSLPVIKSGAYEYNVSGFLPAKGLIKTTTTKPVQFSFKASGKIDIVTLAIGEEKRKKMKQVNAVYEGGVVKFNYIFDVENSYPVTILINNKPVLTYYVASDEKE